MKKVIIFMLFAFFYSGCDDSTKIETCGDGVVDPDEECDLNNMGGVSCTSLGYYDGNITCTDDCKFIFNCTERCGDGEINGTETCDGTNISITDCTEITGATYVSGTVTCASNCQYDISQCVSEGCGNGVIDVNEDCEESNLNGGSCVDFGFGGGTLSCNRSCQFETSGCYHTFNQLTAGSWHYCGLDINGNAWCWGSNAERQIGDGNPDEFRTQPSQVFMPQGVTFRQISAGEYHTCAVDTDDKIWCWGQNSSGQLGTGDTNSSSIPVPLFPVEYGSVPVTFLQVSAGAYHTCAISTTNKVYCWGDNSQKQLQYTSGELSTIPVMFVVSNIKYVEAGGFFNFIEQTYSAAWGANSNGELGFGNTNSPQAGMGYLSGVSFQQLSCGGYHSCGIRSTGEAQCWGKNDSGQVGSGSTENKITVMTNITTPLNVTFTSVQAGAYNHSCGVTDTGKIYCWGDNGWGHLGNGGTTPSSGPVSIEHPEDVYFIEVATGYSSTCALDSNREVWCWGDNYNGELGDGTQTSSPIPVKVLMPQ